MYRAEKTLKNNPCKFLREVSEEGREQEQALYFYSF